MIEHDVSNFVLAAYAISGAVLAGLGAWVFLDARRLRRQIAALEATGSRRRSATAPKP